MDAMKILKEQREAAAAQAAENDIFDAGEWFLTQLRFVARDRKSFDRHACIFLDKNRDELYDYFFDAFVPFHTASGEPDAHTDEGMDCVCAFMKQNEILPDWMDN